MESLKKNFSVSLLAAPLTNFVLLISMVGLSIWVFFSLNDLIQTVGSLFDITGNEPVRSWALPRWIRFGFATC